jgi:hypothetical protein
MMSPVDTASLSNISLIIEPEGSALQPVWNTVLGQFDPPPPVVTTGCFSAREDERIYPQARRTREYYPPFS